MNNMYSSKVYIQVDKQKNPRTLSWIYSRDYNYRAWVNSFLRNIVYTLACTSNLMALCIKEGRYMPGMRVRNDTLGYGVIIGLIKAADLAAQLSVDNL